MPISDNVAHYGPGALFQMDNGQWIMVVLVIASKNPSALRFKFIFF